MANEWSETEVEAAVGDYFAMLQKELAGQKYNKAEHRRGLREKLDGRSDGAVELKHQNISAVLIELGVPYIDGYKPRANYQRSVLPSAVQQYLGSHPELLDLFEADCQQVPAIPSVADFLAALESPPETERERASATAEKRGVYVPAGINYLEREARNQSLGEAGEQFVLNFERARLVHLGKESLAGNVEQVSRTVGPGAGYDIRSFESDGTERYIEAKTTKYGKSTPFFVTPNEVEFSRRHARNYFLYRVFRFREVPGLYTLQGGIEDRCELRPSEYLAVPG